MEGRRRVILCTFASDREERILNQYEVDWFQEADQCWDIQKANYAVLVAQNMKKSLPSLEDVVDYLSIDVGNGLVHNGGNDSISELQVLVAGSMLTDSEWNEMRLGNKLSKLPNTWNLVHKASNWKNRWDCKK